MVNYPSDWEVVTVESIADINTGCRNTQDNNPNGRYKFFVRSPIVEHIDVADYNCEAVLTAGDGVGTGKVYHYVNGKFSAHQRVYIINNFRNIMGRFFYYYFSQNFMKEVEKYTAKSSVDSVRRAMIANMLIPLPSLTEQQAIADTLTAFDTHITNLATLIDKKKAIRDGALDDLMSGRTRLKGFSGEREVKKLGEIVNIRRGKRVVRKQLSKTGKIPVFQNSVTPLGYFGSYNCSSHSAFIIAGGNAGDVGFSDVNFWAADDCYFFEEHERMSQKFLYYLLLHHNIYIYEQTRRTSIPRLSRDVLNKLLVFLPTLDEQIAIAGTLTALDDEITALEAEREKFIQIRDGAMNDLLTGKVRLKI